MTDRKTRPMARTLRRFGLGVLIGAPFTVAGCFTLARPTPPLEEYVLGAGPRAVAAARDSGGVTIGLRRLDLAPYLSTTAIVVRRGSRIVTNGFRRWGEEPSAGIVRAVAASLGAAAAILAVDVVPWPARAQHDYLIQLHVTQLEGVAAADATATEGEVRVAASWEIVRAQDGTLVARGETDRREAGWKVGDYGGLVTRVDEGLTGLASDLAACLGRLGPPVTPVPDAAAGGRVVVCGAR